MSESTKAYLVATQCANCAAELGKLQFFCRPCWFRLPTKERTQVVNMHMREQDLTTKLQKCVRILQGRPVA